MEWQRDSKAAPGQRPAASACRWFGSGESFLLTVTGFLLLGQVCFSEESFMPSFPDCPSLLPFLHPISLVLSSLTGQASSSARLLFLNSTLALQQPRCASRGIFKERSSMIGVFFAVFRCNEFI